jgi:hypothetical protein
MIVLPLCDDACLWPLAPTDDAVDLMEPSGKIDEDLMRCLHRVSFVDASSKLICFADFDPRSWEALTLSEGLAAKRAVETAQASNVAELESVAAAQANRILELEEGYANLNLKKENVTSSYRRPSEKYKKLQEKANAIEREKSDVVEAHTTQLAEVEEKLVKLTQDYRDYHWDVQHCLRELHEVLMALLGEVGARRLPFPAMNVLIDDYISWFEEEVKVVLGVLWQLNDNFVVLAIKGVLNMLGTVRSIGFERCLCRRQRSYEGAKDSRTSHSVMVEKPWLT